MVSSSPSKHLCICDTALGCDVAQDGECFHSTFHDCSQGMSRRCDGRIVQCVSLSQMSLAIGPMSSPRPVGENRLPKAKSANRVVRVLSCLCRR